MNLDQSRTIVSANICFCEMIGYAREEVLGQKLERFLSMAGRVFYQTHVWPLMGMANEVNEIHLSLSHREGQSVPVLFNARREGDESTCVLFPIEQRLKFEDEIIRAKNQLSEANSETVRINKELLALQEELEARVEMRTAELMRANEEMESFTYSIAHDFRAPLRAISSSARMLMEDMGDDLPEEHLRILLRQSVNSEKLGKLIDDLLGLSRLSRVPVELVEVDITRVAEEIVSTLERAEALYDCKVTIQPGMRALASENLLWVLLSNLIGNACKFSPSGGEVTVSSCSSEGRTVFSVQDQGVGFDMAYARKIFLPFERLVQEKDFAGNGIGLASAHRAVLRLKGNIWAESAVGEGATFFFTLGD